MKSTLIMIIMIMTIGCHARSQRRIVGGKVASPENCHNIVRMEVKWKISEIPQMVANLHLCTATVLTSTWVLTAAHCIVGYQNMLRDAAKLKPKLIIRYGSVFSIPWTNDSFSIVYKMIKHPSYRYFEFGFRIFQSNDIGLLKTSPIELDRYKKVSAVDYSTLVGLPISAAGYGLTKAGNFIGDTLILRKPLQTLDVLVTKCPKDTSDVLYPALCLRRRCGESSSICPGDSGGPLLHSSGVVGVIAMGAVPDCFQNRSGKHIWSAFGTPISPYIQWISEHIKDST